MTNINFRKFVLDSGKEVLCGKDSEQNELVVAQSENNEVVLHTKAVGSPFCNIKGNKNPTKKDLEQAAIICAAYSKDWKQHKSNVEVHVFKGKDIFKEADMKTGTFGVKRAKSIKVNKKDILNFLANVIK